MRGREADHRLAEHLPAVAVERGGLVREPLVGVDGVLVPARPLVVGVVEATAVVDRRQAELARNLPGVGVDEGHRAGVGLLVELLHLRRLHDLADARDLGMHRIGDRGDGDRLMEVLMEERLEVRDQGRDPVGVVHDDRRRSVAGHPRPGLVGVVVLPVLGVADDEEGPHQAVDVVRRRGQRLVDAADAQHLPEVGDQGPVGGRRRVHHQHRPQHVGMDGALEGVETRGGQGDRLLADEAAVVVERHALGAGRPDHAVGIVVAQGVGRADDELHLRARGGDRE